MFLTHYNVGGISTGVDESLITWHLCIGTTLSWREGITEPPALTLNGTRRRWSQDHDSLLQQSYSQLLTIKLVFHWILQCGSLTLIETQSNLTWNFGFKRDELNQKAPSGHAFVLGNIGLSGSLLARSWPRKVMRWAPRFCVINAICTVAHFTSRVDSAITKGPQRHH